MSTARTREGKANNSVVSNHEQQPLQLQPELKLHELSSSSWGRNDNNKINISNNNSTSMSTHSLISHRVEESDEDLLTVPDVEHPTALESTIANDNTTNSALPVEIQNQKRRRGRNPADKEYRRLKRLLRNRVSAQQARERKKVYVNDLELRAKQLQDRNSKLEEKISTLINENTMLRKVLLNTRPKVDESTEQKQDTN